VRGVHGTYFEPTRSQRAREKGDDDGHGGTFLFVRLEAKPGKEEAVERFLRDALPGVQAECDTPAWFAIRMGPSSFAIFGAFPDEAGRQAALSGQVAAALMKKAPELLAESLHIDKADVH
jgi:hypothetical protein